MREIIFSTESTSDIPEEIIQQYGFRVIPFHIKMNDGDYADSYVFPIAQIYNHCARTRKPPRTAAPNEKEYTNYFQEIRDDSPDGVILHFSVSSALSGAYQTAQDASKKFDDLYVINTRTITVGCLVYMIAAYDLVQKKQAQGEITDYSELANEIRHLSPQIACAFTPGNVEFLILSELVTNKDELGGARPMVEPDAIGHLVSGTKIRGSKRKIAPLFFQEFLYEYNLRRDALYFVYTAGCSSSITDGIQRLAEKEGFENFVSIQACGVSTCKSGPAAFGLAGFIEDEPADTEEEPAAIEGGQAAIGEEQAPGGEDSSEDRPE